MRVREFVATVNKWISVLGFSVTRRGHIRSKGGMCVPQKTKRGRNRMGIWLQSGDQGWWGGREKDSKGGGHGGGGQAKPRGRWEPTE